MESRSERVWPSRLGALLALIAFGASGCGGSENHVSSPAHAAPVSASTRDEPNTEDAERTPEPAQGAPCADGSCTTCGPGICPAGWYCDESAVGGPACGWVPECARKSSCACLHGELPSACQCSEQEGGLHVTCR